MSRIYKSIEIESRLMVARGWEMRKKRVTANKYKVSLCGHEKCSGISADGCTTL